MSQPTIPKYGKTSDHQIAAALQHDFHKNSLNQGKVQDHYKSKPSSIKKVTKKEAEKIEMKRAPIKKSSPTPVKIRKEPTLPGGQVAPATAISTIPPSIRVTASAAVASFSNGALNLPETWSWRADGVHLNPKYDLPNSSRLAAKKSITLPLNQGMCGSCWAFSLAGAISDVFTVAGKYIDLPKTGDNRIISTVSPTGLISCVQNDPNYPINNKCQGGNVAAVAQYLEKNGVYTSSCVDYSWYYDNPQFSNPANLSNGVAINAATPQGCGCVVDIGSRKLFTINNVHLYPVSDASELNPTNNLQVGFNDGSSPSSLQITWDSVRRWLWEVGPVVSTLVVYNNLMGGDFSATDGVYFESCSKYPIPDAYSAYPWNAPHGGHAVRIVGWGIQKNCTMPDGTSRDQPYWMVANSWGTGWGDNGYFKVARYDKTYNPTAQFDILYQDQNHNETGGIICFTAGDIIQSDKNFGLQGSVESFMDPIRQAAGFYNQDVGIGIYAPVSNHVPIVPNEQGSGSDSDYSLPINKQPYFVIILVLVIIGGILGYVLSGSKKRLDKK